MKHYDVWFTLTHPANLVVDGNDIQEAVNNAQNILLNMSKEELIERLLAAISYEGVKVVGITEVEE